MQSVFEKMPIAAFLLGEQPIKAEALYRRASFCVLCNAFGVNIAYNALTKELCELSEAQARLLSQSEVKADGDSAELIRSYFLVPKDQDERKLCDGVAAFARAAKKSEGYRDFTVFTTTECNARCFYCYENDCERVSMSEETAQKTAQFIADSSRGKAVTLTWYGGEPLMNTRAIDIITGMLSERGTEFTSVLATNASLLTDELIRHAKEKWHLDKVQVTLDGTAEVYERIKAYTDRKNAFSDVLCNIEKLASSGIRINIRLNVDTHNIDDMYSLCDLLADRFGGTQGLNVYAALLFDCEGAKRPISQCDRTALARRVIEFEDSLMEKGILKPRKLSNTPATVFCKADSPASLVIRADGSLTKCDFYTDTHTVGDVYSGVCKEREMAEMNSFAERVDCDGCSAYPICLRKRGCPTGGCDEARRYITEQRLVRSIMYAYRAAKEDK